MGFDLQYGTTPLSARQNMPLGSFLLILFIIFALIALIGLIVKKYLDYRKTPEYQQKEAERITNYRDVEKFCKDNNISDNEKKILFAACQAVNLQNINYISKNYTDIKNRFREAYFYLTDNNFPDEDISTFFALLYTLEKIIARDKYIDTTKKIQPGASCLCILTSSSIIAFKLLENTKDALIFEIPQAFYESHDKPKTMEKLQFSFNHHAGLTYFFVTRLIRYDLSDAKCIKLISSHTDKLIVQVQRNSRRHFIQDKCFISSAKKNPLYKDKGDKKSRKNGIKEKPFISSQKIFASKLSNISAGGCCIHTNLPIKEGQYISLIFPTLKINERIIGIIKKTRKLSDGKFALHIQFVYITTKARNRIYACVYEYDKPVEPKDVIEKAEDSGKNIPTLQEEPTDASGTNVDSSSEI